MILLLGATGYIGRAFADELRRSGRVFIPLSRQAVDYTQFDILFDYVRITRPELVINAASYSGRPNVDACENARLETFRVNTLLPQTIARVCLMNKVTWAQVSTGCLYTGAKVFDHGDIRIETELNQSPIRSLFAAHPDWLLGFSETDEPNFTFRNPSFNFYSGTRSLAEEALKSLGGGYIWRPILPFEERDAPCNFLSRIQGYPKVFDHLTSLSHLGDCVRACLQLWDLRAPLGTYNVANPGAVSTRQVIEMITRILQPSRRFEYWANDDDFYTHGAKALRSTCILDVSKILNLGVRLRPVQEALEHSLHHWYLPEPLNHRADPPLPFMPCRLG